MTPALKRKIGARIRALHRAGKYRRSRARPARVSRRRRRVAALSISRPSYRRRSSRRSGIRRSFRRRSGGGRLSGMLGGGLFGLGAFTKSDTLKLVGGALGGTFVANYACAFICPKLPSNLGANPFVQAAVKLAVTGLAAKLVSRYSRPVATGMILGAGLVVANDLIRMWTGAGATAAATSQYLGRGSMSQYLGAGGPRPMVGRNVQSLVGPVTPSAATFGSARGMGAIYGNTSAFKSDAWTR